jgi:hypothetical protein
MPTAIVNTTIPLTLWEKGLAKEVRPPRRI